MAHHHEITSRSPAVKAWLESNGYNASAMDPNDTITKIQDAQQAIDDQCRITQASTKILNGILNEGNGDSSRKRKQQEDPERDHSVDRFGRKKHQCKKCGRWVPQGKECYGFDGNGCMGTGTSSSFEDRLNILEARAVSNGASSSGSASRPEWASNMTPDEIAFVLHEVNHTAGESLEDIPLEAVKDVQQRHNQVKLMARSYI